MHGKAWPRWSGSTTPRETDLEAHEAMMAEAKEAFREAIHESSMLH